MGNFKTVQFMFLPADKTEAAIQLREKTLLFRRKGGQPSIWRNNKRTNLLVMLWFWEKKGSLLLKYIFSFVVNILLSIIIAATFVLYNRPTEQITGKIC